MIPIATGTRERRGDEDLIVLTRTVNAPIAEVWANITESDRLAIWFGSWTGDPAQGSVMVTMGFEGDGVEPAEYFIDVCREPHHLAITSAMDYDAENPAVWHLEFDLEEVAGTTTITFSQKVPDPTWAENIGPGWEFYLDRLVAAVTNADQSAIDFDDYYPAQSEHYTRLFS